MILFNLIFIDLDEMASWLNSRLPASRSSVNSIWSAVISKTLNGQRTEHGYRL